MIPVLRKNIINDGISLSSLNTLEKNGAIIQEKLEITRLIDQEEGAEAFKALSSSQDVALKEIHQACKIELSYFMVLQDQEKLKSMFN